MIIQVYITNAYRAYRIADHYRRKGAHVALGGLHVTSLPEEAAPHADTIFLGPGEDTFPQFLRDLAAGTPQRRYQSSLRTLEDIPPIRRDLIKRSRYLVPNSIVVSRGCPHHCTFCYKDAFFEGGRSFYTQRVDDALAEIARLPGRHLYFLDDHLLGNRRFSRELFTGMRGMNRVFQGAATVDSILRDDTIELAARAGLRSLFVGFETLSTSGLQGAGKKQNLGRDYLAVIRRLDDLGIMINGSFVFGLDGDDPDVFKRTVDWAVDERHHHRDVPHPHAVSGHAAVFGDGGAEAPDDEQLGSLRHAPRRLSADRHHAGGAEDRLRLGVSRVLSMGHIFTAARAHRSSKHSLKHLAYSAGWKKFEPAWDFVIRLKQLSQMRPMLEAVLSPVAARLGRARTRSGQADAGLERATSANIGSRIGLDGGAHETSSDRRRIGPGLDGGFGRAIPGGAAHRGTDQPDVLRSAARGRGLVHREVRRHHDRVRCDGDRRDASRAGGEPSAASRERHRRTGAGRLDVDPRTDLHDHRAQGRPHFEEGLIAHTGPNARNCRGLSFRIIFNVASGIPAFNSIGANTVTA